jgi:hypothetical protein
MALQAHCAAQIKRYCRWALRSIHTFSAINGKAQHSGGTTCSYSKDPASGILPQMLTSQKYVPFSQKLSRSAFSQVLSDRVFSNQAAKVQIEDDAKRRWHFPVAVGSTFVVSSSPHLPPLEHIRRCSYHCKHETRLKLQEGKLSEIATRIDKICRRGVFIRQEQVPQDSAPT